MKYFSAKVATQESFCNREEERKALMRSMQQNEHVVVAAPRRYGKTSLIVQAIREAAQPFAKIDLFCVVYEDEVTRKIAKGVSEIAQQLLNRTDKTLTFLGTVFKSATIGLRASGFEIMVDFSKNTTIIEHIEDLLSGLERIAEKYQKRAVLFIDEFQDILKIDHSTQIQAAIRAIAQHSKYITYIFSGSSRVMLEKIFDDANQPLYMMCKKIPLNRIQDVHLQNHIQKASQAKWGSLLPDAVIQKILTLTECHTYYVNVLCAELIELPKPPDASTVQHFWNNQLLQYHGKIIAELEKLNTNRLKVLSTIALMGSAHRPNSKDFLTQVRMPLATVQATVKYLLDNDYLYQTPDHGLQLVDPLMKDFLSRQYH